MLTDQRRTGGRLFHGTDNTDLVYGSKSVHIDVKSITPAYGRVRAYVVDHGRFILQADSVRRSQVVVLGSEIAKDLFGGLEPVGRTLIINNLPFEVVGTLRSKGALVIADIYNRSNKVDVFVGNFRRKIYDSIDRGIVTASDCQNTDTDVAVTIGASIVPPATPGFLNRTLHDPPTLAPVDRLPDRPGWFRPARLPAG